MRRRQRRIRGSLYQLYISDRGQICSVGILGHGKFYLVEAHNPKSGQSFRSLHQEEREEQ